MIDDPLQQVLDYLKRHHLLLTTAESCTAGRMVALLAEKPGSGEALDSGIVVYSPEAKQRLLGVRAKTIERCGLTSEEVSREMACGALKDSAATVAIAVTGVAGPEGQGDTAPGTLCFAWAFAGPPTAVFTVTQRFFGDRLDVLRQGALFGLTRLVHYHGCWLRGEQG